MGLYRRKPTMVAAIQWRGDNLDEIEAFCKAYDLDWAEPAPYVLGGVLTLWVRKSKAWCSVYPNGWVIAEADGQGFYSNTEAAFAAAYEPADE